MASKFWRPTKWPPAPTKHGYGRNCRIAVLVRGDTGTRADTPGYTYPAVSHLFRIKKRGKKSGYGRYSVDTVGTREPASPPQPRLEAAAAWTRFSGRRLAAAVFPSPALPPTKNIHPAERKMARRSTTRKKDRAGRKMGTAASSEEEDIGGGAVFSSALCSSQAAGGNEKRTARGAD